MRPLFQLSPRLAICADLIRGGRPFCDVGVDHAYLPIWLIKTGKVPRAVAADVAPGPLATALGNARRYRVEDRLSLVLSDGLREIGPEDAWDVNLAGMGGELILRIVGETLWLRDPERRLVLQPMSSVRDLRLGLTRLGFTVEREEAVEDADRVYSAFSCVYTGGPPEGDPLFPWMGKLEPGAVPVTRYAQKIRRDLLGRLEGARRGRGEDDPKTLETTLELLELRYLGYAHSGK